MLLEYNGKIFNAKEANDKVYIWRYKKTAGFEKKKNSRGNVCYVKEIDKSYAKDFFSVKFFAKQGERLFPIIHLGTQSCYIFCDDNAYAALHGFTKTENGVYVCEKSLDEFDGFSMAKYPVIPYQDELYELTRRKLFRAWKTYVTDVSLWEARIFSRLGKLS